MYISRSGGSCDCGMAEVMNPDGFCSAHRTQDAPSAAPADRDAIVSAVLQQCPTLQALNHVAAAAMALVVQPPDGPLENVIPRVLLAASHIAGLHWACRRLFAQLALAAVPGPAGAGVRRTWMQEMCDRVVALAFNDDYVTLLCTLVAEIDVKLAMAFALTDVHDEVGERVRLKRVKINSHIIVISGVNLVSFPPCRQAAILVQKQVFQPPDTDPTLQSRHVRLTVQVYACAGNIVEQIIEARLLQRITTSLLKTLLIATERRRTTSRLAASSGREDQPVTLSALAVAQAAQRNIRINLELQAGFVGDTSTVVAAALFFLITYPASPPLCPQPPPGSPGGALGAALRRARLD